MIEMCRRWASTLRLHLSFNILRLVPLCSISHEYQRSTQQRLTVLHLQRPAHTFHNTLRQLILISVSGISDTLRNKVGKKTYTIRHHSATTIRVMAGSISSSMLKWLAVRTGLISRLYIVVNSSSRFCFASAPCSFSICLSSPEWPTSTPPSRGRLPHSPGHKD